MHRAKQDRDMTRVEESQCRIKGLRVKETKRRRTREDAIEAKKERSEEMPTPSRPLKGVLMGDALPSDIASRSEL